MRLSLLIPAVALALGALSSAGVAQKLEPGKWTGTVTPPDDPTVQVTYDVKVSGDTISIQLDAGEHGKFDFKDVKLMGGKLTFNWAPGSRLDCSLDRREDGSFAGKCVDSEGAPGELVMIPPRTREGADELFRSRWNGEKRVGARASAGPQREGCVRG